MFSKPDGNGDRTIYESYRTSCTVICSTVVNNKYSISDKDGADQNLTCKCTMCYTCTYMHLSYKIHTHIKLSHFSSVLWKYGHGESCPPLPIHPPKPGTGRRAAFVVLRGAKPGSACFCEHGRAVTILHLADQPYNCPNLDPRLWCGLPQHQPHIWSAGACEGTWSTDPKFQDLHNIG